jgi:hypothetical protein
MCFPISVEFWTCSHPQSQVAAQLNMMKEEVRRVSNEYAMEKRKREKTTQALAQLWTVVEKAFPGNR